MTVSTISPPIGRAAPRIRAGRPEPWWKAESKAILKPRVMLLGLLLLTYVWRFHDLSGLISPFRFAAIATVGSWFYLVFDSRASHLRALIARPAARPLILGVLWAGVTVPFALNPEVAWETWWGTHFKTLTMFLFLLTCFTSLHAVKQAMAVHIVGASLLAFFYAKGGFALWGSPVPMYDVNDMALHLNMAMPFVLFFAIRAPRGWLRLSLWGLLALLTVCALMTQSRGAFLTVGLLTVAILLNATGVKFWIRLLPPVLVVLTYVFAPVETKERLSTLFTPTQDYNVDDEEGRIEIWKRAFGYVSEYPLTGVGMSNFHIAESTLSLQAQQRRPGWDASVAHNSFVEVGAETGLPGLSLFALMLFGALFRLTRIRNLARRHLRGTSAGEEVVLAAEALSLSIVAYCIGGFFLSMAYAPIIYSVIAMAIGLDLSANRILRLSMQQPNNGGRAVLTRSNSLVVRPGFPRQR